MSQPEGPTASRQLEASWCPEQAAGGTVGRKEDVDEMLRKSGCSEEMPSQGLPEMLREGTQEITNLATLQLF